MVHIGRRWKLAFRRDFNINLFNNNDGLPESYQFQWTRSIFTPPPLPFYFDLQLDYAGELGTDTLQWLGLFPEQPYGIAAAKYTVQLSGVPAAADKRLRLSDATGSDLLLATIDPGEPHFSISDNLGNTVTFIDPSFAITFPYPPVPANYPVIWGGNPT